MKKLISSILALSLVAGMSVTAFAAANDMRFSTQTAVPKSVGTSVPYDTTTNTVELDLYGLTIENDDFTSGATDWRTATRAEIDTEIGGKITITPAVGMNVTAVTFAPSSSGKVMITYTTVDATTAMASGSPTALDFSVRIDIAAGGYVATSRTINYTGTFKTSNVVAGMKIDDVVGGTGVPIGDTAGVKVTGMTSDSNNASTPSDLGNLDIRPDSEIFLYLKSSDFDWIYTSGGGAATPTPPVNVSTAQLRTGKITIRKSVSKGSNTIENIEFDSDTAHGAYVHIEFVEWFVSVNEQDVDFTIYLAKSGSKRSGTEVNIAGTMENEQDEVDEGDDYISTEDGTVFEAQDYVRNCEVYLGNGVYITTNLFKDKKYYGIALNTYDSTDSAIMDEYPEIDNVLTLKTVNLKGSGNIVHFDMSGDYYVYGADGTYLGLSSEKVAYSDKYYFATERISMGVTDADDDDDDILDEDDDDDYIGPSDGGGDDANNANDNPGTGVNGFVGVAVAAGLISLAAVGVTARKKK